MIRFKTGHSMSMNPSGQEAFIRKIRSALGHPPNARRRDNGCCIGTFTDKVGAILDRIKNRSKADKQQLLNRFIEMAEPIKLEIKKVSQSGSIH
jgi:hypothetical protein